MRQGSWLFCSRYDRSGCLCNHIDSAKQNEVYNNLAEIVEDEPPKENEGVTFSEDKDYLAEYLELYRQNEDMVGWIKVEDTNINYPVV